MSTIADRLSVKLAEVDALLDEAVEAVLNTVADPSTSKPTRHRYAVVRGDRSGVFVGVVESEDGQTVELSDCRHVWSWAGAANTAEMALRGVSKPEKCQFVAPVKRLRVLDAIEVIDCTPEAEASLRAVHAWSKA